MRVSRLGLMAVLAVVCEVVCGGVVGGIERQETPLECGDTFTLDFSSRWPEVQCSSPCREVHTWAAGPVFKREARLEQYGLMVRQEYGEDGMVTCSLVDDISDYDALQSSLQAEACSSVSPSITTTTDSSVVTDQSTTTGTGGSSVVTDQSTTTGTGGSSVVTDQSTTTGTGGSSVVTDQSTTTGTGGSTEVTESTTITVESTTLIECVTHSDEEITTTPETTVVPITTITQTTASPTTTEPQWVCERGWSLYESSCYKIDNDIKLDWLQGQIYCNGINAEYAKITSSGEAAFLKERMTDSSWIGLNDQSSEGNFLWTDTSTPAFTEWHSGEPNNAGNEDCTEMRASMDFLWNDSTCKNMKSVLCEKPAYEMIG